MSDHACVICARNDPADGWTTCRRCLDRLDDNLARIAELVTWASSWLMPRTGSGNTGRSVPASRPPLDIAALDAACANDVLPLLESWIRIIREDAGLAPYGVATEANGATVDGSVTFLRSWLLWAAERPDFPIDDMAQEIRELAQSLERLNPEHDSGLDLSRLKCPADHPEADGRNCGNALHVDPSRPRDPIVCRRCGTEWTSERLVLVALSTPGDPIWMTAQPICAWLGIGSVTLNKWVRDGHVTKRGTLFNVQEAIAVVRTG